jgi:hypothetical protein
MQYTVTGWLVTPCRTLTVTADSEEDAIEIFEDAVLENAGSLDMHIEDIQIVDPATESGVE